jgi:hypothetical protein
MAPDQSPDRYNNHSPIAAQLEEAIHQDHAEPAQELAMVLFADYEGLGVVLFQVFWFLVTIPVLLCGLTGAIVGALRVPRPRLAIWLGSIACFIEVAAVIVVQLAFSEELSLRGAFAERFRPGLFFWGLSLVAMVLALLSLGLGLARYSTARVTPAGDAEQVGQDRLQ